jgi:hypothetical protein
LSTEPRLALSPQVRKKLKELNLTAEEVVRKELGIKPEGFDAGKGVVFPEGTRFLWWYHDAPHGGIVKDGALVIKGKPYAAVSAAAASITGRKTQNGWACWDVQRPGDTEYRPIASFRTTRS